MNRIELGIEGARGSFAELLSLLCGTGLEGEEICNPQPRVNIFINRRSVAATVLTDRSKATQWAGKLVNG